MGIRKDSGPVPPGTKAIRLTLTEEQQQRLRVEAAKAGLSMAAFARVAVLEKIGAARKSK